MSLADLLAPPGDLEGESLPVFMQRWTQKLPPKPKVDPSVRVGQIIDEAWADDLVDTDRLCASVRQTLRAKREALEAMPSNTTDAEERLLLMQIQKIKNLEYDAEHYDG